MKRFISVLSSLLVLPAFAEVAPVYYDDVVEYTDDMIGVEDSVETTQSQNAVQKPVINRSTSASRAVPSATAVSSRTNTSSRAVASSPRTATSGSTRGTVARTAKTSRTAVTSRNAQTTKPVTARIGMANVKNVMSGDRNADGKVYLTDSGTSLYNSTSAVSNQSSASRVGVVNRRASARLSTVSAPVTTTTPVITQEEVTSTTNNLTAIAELTDYCKAQYAACMDNYCNVLDDNQGRCSCSKNIKNYEKTENALAQATEEFQNVVQQIRYIGLTSDQVESLFTETEAELTMKSNTDSSRLKNSLDSIKKKIIDVSTPTASSTALTNGLSLDLNGLLTADFTAGFDLNSFLNLNNKNTESVSNQRGEQLYKTAANRCKTAVLNSCTVQGIDANVITNAYDLEIDKQCVLYERSLNEANAEMKTNVTNAAVILQQARLLLAQNRNSYDFRGCIAAIDACMQDEYVCGSDYELCLDPTGKYLSDGEIIKGGTPGVAGGMNKTEPVCSSYDESLQANTNPATDGHYDVSCLTNWYSGGMYHLYSVWDYEGTKKSNAWSIGPNENLGAYVDAHLKKWKSTYKNSKDTTQSDNMAMYLLQKIGYIDENDKVHGMCASVMKQCQDYTYSSSSSKKSSKKYVPDNEVIRQYLNATLPKLKTQQDSIISDYAENCKSDVQSCLSTNGYEESNTGSTASKTAVNACASEITTCMSVGGYQVSEGVRLTLRAMTDWVSSILLTCPSNQKLVDNGVGAVSCVPCESTEVIVDGRELLDETYPDAPYLLVAGAINDNATSQLVQLVRPTVELVSSGGRATECSCPDGYADYYTKAELQYSMSGEYDQGTHLCIDTSIRCGYRTAAEVAADGETCEKIQ